MPTVIVENIPTEVYERLRQRAEAEQRSVPEETLHLLDQALRQEVTPPPRVPDIIPSEEISAPFDLPRTSEPVPASAYNGQPRWPDPLDAQLGE